MTAHIPLFLENNNTSPAQPPHTQNQGCQTIYQIRKSVHTEHPTTSTSFHAKHEETLVTVSAFSSQEAESRWLPSEGTVSEGAIYSEKHSSRTWGLQPQNRYAGKNVFHSETGRERDSEQADVNCGHPGEDAVPGSHTVLHLTVVWTQGGR